MIKPWATIDSKPVGDFRILKIRSDLKRSPRTGQTHDFFVIESVDWVNVIAVTRDNYLVMVDQYRHGSNTVELEVPGGVMDPGDASPSATGTRELREETGYDGENPLIIGQIYSNPAIMNNTCFTLLVQNCHLKHSTVFDHSEDINTRLVPVGAIPDLVATGKVRHSLVVVALYHYQLWRQRQKAKTDTVS
jgi:ADP-ribose pyrophosphatase